MATSVTGRWRFLPEAVEAGIDYNGLYAEVSSVLLATFATVHSLALQQTLFAMGKAAIEARPEIAEVRFAMPNRHHFVYDLAPFGLENPNEVFYAADRPYGLIEGTITRDGAALAAPDALAWTSPCVRLAVRGDAARRMRPGAVDAGRGDPSCSACQALRVAVCRDLRHVDGQAVAALLRRELVREHLGGDEPGALRLRMHQCCRRRAAYSVGCADRGVGRGRRLAHLLGVQRAGSSRIAVIAPALMPESKMSVNHCGNWS